MFKAFLLCFPCWGWFNFENHPITNKNFKSTPIWYFYGDKIITLAINCENFEWSEIWDASRFLFEVKCHKIFICNKLYRIKLSIYKWFLFDQRFICIPLLLCFLVPFLLEMLNSTYTNKGGGDDSVWHIMLQGGRGWKEETIQISETYLSMIKDFVWQTKTNFPRNQGIFISIDEKHLRFWGIELFLLTWFLSTKMLIIK